MTTKLKKNFARNEWKEGRSIAKIRKSSLMYSTKTISNWSRRQIKKKMAVLKRSLKDFRRRLMMTMTWMNQASLINLRKLWNFQKKDLSLHRSKWAVWNRGDKRLVKSMSTLTTTYSEGHSKKISWQESKMLSSYNYLNKMTQTPTWINKARLNLWHLLICQKEYRQSTLRSTTMLMKPRKSLSGLLPRYIRMATITTQSQQSSRS